MADQQAKGSIILKIVIVLFVVGLVLVITIPGEIWTKEKDVEETCRDNMLSVYEAHRYYFQLKGEYAPDMENLILAIQNDSSLLNRQEVVKYTVRLRDAMDTYLNSPLIKNLYEISENVNNMHEDLVQNERYFKSQDPSILEANVLQRAEELKSSLSALRGGVEFGNYVNSIMLIDTLHQVRRDLSDYSLQTAARRSSNLSSGVKSYLPNVNPSVLANAWRPISAQVTDFIGLINSVPKLKETTTVADRLADFQGKVASAFSVLNSGSTSAYLNEANQLTTNLEQVYQEFLGDFLITGFFAQYRLSETDSMLLALNDDNFTTPLDNIPYIIALGDSMEIRVEDPTLLEPLKEMAMAEVERVNQLPFMRAFSAYSATLDSLQKYYINVKRSYRRNLDITIKTKELDDLIPRIKDVAAFSAFNSYDAFAQQVPASDSYSEIKELSSDAFVASGQFIQIYGDNFFGRLDTLHTELIGHLNEFEELVSANRRNTFSFTWAVDEFNNNLSQIKSSSGNNVASLQTIRNGLEEIFIYSSEGDSRRVYGIFSTQVVNHGKVYGRTAQKSWEEME